MGFKRCGVLYSIADLLDSDCVRSCRLKGEQTSDYVYERNCVFEERNHLIALQIK